MAKLIRFGGLLALAAALMLAAGCMQRVDSEPPVTKQVDVPQVKWEYAGAFGGPAEVSAASADPWEVRYKPGGFLQIRGLDVTEDEVWVCDLGISRIQVFDYNGQVLRQYGEGVPIDGTLASNKDIYLEEENYPYREQTKPPRWEDGPGLPWVTNQTGLFKAADVAVIENGFIISDQARTGGQRKPKRRDEIAVLYRDGSRLNVKGVDVSWPEYLAVDGTQLACAEPRGNTLTQWEIGDADRWAVNRIGSPTEYEKLMDLEVNYSGSNEYLMGQQLAGNTGYGPKEFAYMGGLALAFDKLIACDIGNQRLQVFEARRDNAERWGNLIRIIPGKKKDGGIRFHQPRNLTVDSAGYMFLVDVLEMEIVVLDPKFERIGSFGRDHLRDVYDLDISPDGRQLFLTDRELNQVLHYVRGD
ncbi:hypothetical protein JW859_06000 [bacterium]|nr:hypothetical protein [bacterium]